MADKQYEVFNTKGIKVDSLIRVSFPQIGTTQKGKSLCIMKAKNFQMENIKK